MDLKFDIMKHPNVALTADGKGKPYQHGKVTMVFTNIQFDEDFLEEATEVEQSIPIQDVICWSGDEVLEELDKEEQVKEEQAKEE